MEGPQSAQVRLYYCIRSTAEAPFVENLAEIAARTDKFDLVVVKASKDARLTAARIAEDFSNDLSWPHISFYSPAAMQRQLQQDFRTHGVPARRLSL